MGGVEIELKAGLSEAAARQLQKRLEAEQGAGQGPDRLRTVYFDDDDDSLARAGLALRIRREGRRLVQTVKAARQSLAGFQQVREIDSAVKGWAPRLDAVPDPKIRAALAAAAGEGALRPRYETQVARTRWQVRAPGGLVEVALDRGRIRAGAAAHPILEVELELLGGSPAAVFALAQTLLGDGEAWLGLPNKAARGVALARGTPLVPTVLGSKPDAPEPGTAAHLAFEAGLAQLAAVVAANLHMVLTSDAPEGPHQLRVALRRLRALLKLHRRGLARGLARSLAEEARHLGQIVSPLRDADVLLPRLLADSGRVDAALGDALAAMHRRQRAATRRELKAAGATAFAIRLLEQAALGGWRRNGDERSIESRAAPVLRDLWASIYPRADALAWLPEEERHELRKLLKKLRYVSEYTPPSVSKEFTQCLRRLQEDLGELNDLSVLAHWQPPLADAAARAAFAEARKQLMQGSRQRADLALGRACRHWLALRACALPWQSWPS